MTFLPARRYHALLAYLAVILIASIPLFAHLDEYPIQEWDEMRNAQNGFEMLKSGRLIVTMIDNAPDAWNLKPPMHIWLLAMSQWLFGYNELAVRVPSALAGLATCLLLLQFCKRQLGSWLPGFFAALVLITTAAYVDNHGTRTADYDALLTLFTTATVCCLANFTEGGSRKWIYVASLMLICAVLTKGIAGLLICPGMLAFVLWRKKFLDLLKGKELYIGVAAFLLFVGGYYLLREHQQPGYIQLVLDNEIFGRYNNVIETHAGDHFTYYREMTKWAFVPWAFFVVPALIGGLLFSDKRQRNLIFLFGGTALFVLLILSCSKTKLFWYSLPMYPLLSVSIGIFLYQIVLLFRPAPLSERVEIKAFAPFLLILAFFIIPYQKIVLHSSNGITNKQVPELNDVLTYLRDAIKGKTPLNANVICGDDYPLLWYRSILVDSGHPLDRLKPENLKAGQQVIAWEEPVKTYIREHYHTEQKGSQGAMVIYQVIDRIQ
jgi:4-amino-4-deoxy-L-arabinose transferase-like glycosyltransferase